MCFAPYSTHLRWAITPGKWRLIGFNIYHSSPHLFGLQFLSLVISLNISSVRVIMMEIHASFEHFWGSLFSLIRMPENCGNLNGRIIDEGYDFEISAFQAISDARLFRQIFRLYWTVRILRRMLRQTIFSDRKRNKGFFQWCNYWMIEQDDMIYHERNACLFAFPLGRQGIFAILSIDGYNGSIIK